MSKWIEADAFIDDLYEHEFSNWCDKDEVSTLVNDAPSIDIVRCKECKYAHMTYGGDCKHCDMWKDDDDFYLELYLDGDFYCSYGQKGDENVETD